MYTLWNYRYYAVVHPINAKIFTSKSRTIKIILTIWIISITLAVPYLYCKSYAFSISSSLGSVSRYICTDRFDDIDSLLRLFHTTDDSGTLDRPPTGNFRKGFFFFLFVTMYALPSTVILFTCIRIAICLCKPVTMLERTSSLFKVEDNKRKVGQCTCIRRISIGPTNIIRIDT